MICFSRAFFQRPTTIQNDENFDDKISIKYNCIDECNPSNHTEFLVEI